MLISVLTPTLLERSEMLRECRLSVDAAMQFFRPERSEHLHWTDDSREGCAVVMNRLALMAQGHWVLPFADDDILLPGALQVLYDHADLGDIIYAPPLLWAPHIPDPWWFFQEPPAIPSFALIRRELWEELGGYDESLKREEDRDLYTRALAAGAKFVKVDSHPTWVYRLHAGSKSMA